MNGKVSIDTIISNVKLELKSFDEAGQVDEVSLLKNADWILEQLNQSLISPYIIVLDVENYKAETPFNFKQLGAIYKCQVCGGDSTSRWHLGNPLKYVVKDYSKMFCYDQCCITESHEEITRTMYIETKEHKTDYCNQELMSFNENVPKGCVDTNCPNMYSLSLNKFNFDNEYFYFNFKEGTVYLKYLGLELDSDNFPLIPDKANIVQAIEDYLIYTSFKTLYYNGSADAERKMLTAKGLHKESMAEAIYQSKIPKTSKLIAWGNARADRLKVFDVPSKADFYYKEIDYKLRK